MLTHWISRRGWLLLIGILGLCSLIALAVPIQKIVKTPELPILVRVFERKADGQVVRQFEVRDKTFLTRMEEFLPGYRQAIAKRQPTGDHVQLDFFIPGEPHARTIYVWEEAGQEYWSGLLMDYSVRGRFHLLLKCLPIRRMFEMLNSPNEESREVGMSIMAQESDHCFDIVLESCRQQSGYARREAVQQLISLISWHAPKAPRTVCGHPLFMRRLNFIAGPFSGEHPRSAEIRQLALQLLDESTMERDATEILSLVADENTIGELTRRLTESNNWRQAADLIVCLQACLGLPADFERGGMCGNSSAAEFRQFAESEERRTKDAQQKLLAWLRDWSAADPAQRLNVVAATWRSRLDEKYPDYGYLFEDQLKQYQYLLRRGAVMLPAVEAVQATMPDLRQRGRLEFIKAYWTGQCDHTLVDELLRGDRQQQMLACDIIAVAQSLAWKDQLASLLTASSSSKSNELVESNRVEIKATETLVICHGIQAIPFLEASRAVWRGNNVAQRAIEHFQVPSGNF